MDNYMIAVIYGDNDAKRKEKFGQIDMIGNINSNLLHSATLLEYGRKHFPDISMFQKLNINYSPDLIGYFLIELGHVIFFNNSSKSFKTGLMYIPNNISSSLKEVLYKFANEISDYKIILVYDLKMVDGMLEWRSVQSTSEIPTPKEVLDIYFKRQETIIKKR